MQLAPAECLQLAPGATTLPTTTTTGPDARIEAYLPRVELDKRMTALPPPQTDCNPFVEVFMVWSSQRILLPGPVPCLLDVRFQIDEMSDRYLGPTKTWNCVIQGKKGDSRVILERTVFIVVFIDVNEA